MRLLWVTPLYAPGVGGIEVLGAHLLRRFTAHGVEPVVLTSLVGDVRADDVVDGIEVHRVPAIQALRRRDPGLVLRVTAEVAAIKRQAAADVVHAQHVAPVTWFADRAPDPKPARAVLTLHNDLDADRGDDDDHVVRTTAPKLRAADWVTCVSETGRRRALAIAPDIADRCSVIPNGIPLPPAVVAPAHDPVVLAPARLVAPKGIDLLVAAVARVAAHVPDVRLVLAGDGPERERLRRHAVELGVEDRVELLGQVAPDAMPALYDGATVVALPSYSEGLPLVLLEAAAHGRPVVATDVGGVTEALVDGVTGLLVPPGDVDALAAAIERVLLDRRLAVALGEAARARAEERFGLDACADAYLSLYDRLLARV